MSKRATMPPMMACRMAPMPLTMAIRQAPMVWRIDSHWKIRQRSVTGRFAGLRKGMDVVCVCVCVCSREDGG